MRRLLLAGAALGLIGAAPAETGQRLDAHFVADRVLVDAPLASGGRIRWFTDTGGGGPVLIDAAVKRLGLATEKTTADIPDLDPNTRQLRDRLRLKRSAFPAPPTPIFIAPGLLSRQAGIAEDSDGLIGNNWFAGHVWTWDYPAGTLTLEPASWQPAKRDHVVPVGFRRAQGGAPALHFPRITIEIAGERVPMLLDTGATTVLTPTVARKLGGPRVRATSMIVADRVAAWRKAHPDWRVIENAQSGTGSRMIEVPDVKIAGIEVGPVWFTERPNRNFREVMSGAMSGQVEGAIGGNAFHSLRMTIDYVHARAAFRQVADASDVKVDHVHSRRHRRQK